MSSQDRRPETGAASRIATTTALSDPRPRRRTPTSSDQHPHQPRAAAGRPRHLRARNERLRHQNTKLSERLSEVFGDQVFDDASIARTDEIGNLRQRIAELDPGGRDAVDPERVEAQCGDQPGQAATTWGSSIPIAGLRQSSPDPKRAPVVMSRTVPRRRVGLNRGTRGRSALSRRDPHCRKNPPRILQGVGHKLCVTGHNAPAPATSPHHHGIPMAPDMFAPNGKQHDQHFTPPAVHQAP
jgi:hypothetical protein